MKKKRHMNSNVQKLIISIIISGFFLLIGILSLTDNFMPKFESNAHYILFSVAIAVILIPSGFILCISLFQLIHHYYNQYRRNYSYLSFAQQVYSNLDDEFSVVKLKNWDNLVMAEIIPEDAVVCTARYDEDGNIIYRVNVDVEMCTNNYQWFSKKFKF